MAGKPGRGGPPQKRESQRRRRNKPDVAVETASSEGVRGTELTGRHRAISRRWYESLHTSGQSQFYQDSDWRFAEFVVAGMDAFLEKPSAGMFSAVVSAQSQLLTTEGERRRSRLELEAAAASGGAEEDGADVSELDQYRQRLRSGSAS